MPGQAIFKSRDVDNLVDDFAVIATRFDAILPVAYRYDGGGVKKGTRGDAWSICDRQVILLSDALSSLQVALRLHAKKVKAGRNGEPEVEAEVVEVAEPAKVDEQAVKKPAKKRRYRVVSKQVTAERKRAAVI